MVIFPEPINVSQTDPEINNGQFFIVHFLNHSNNGLLTNGFYIELPDLDIQWCMGETEHIAAYQVSPSQVMVKGPSCYWALLNNGKALEEAKKKAGFTHPRIIEAVTVARNDIVQNPDRHYKYWLLNFPVDVELGLNNDVFSPNAENGKLVADVHFVETKVEVNTNEGKKTLTSVRANIVWNIAITERINRYVKEAEPRSNPLDNKVTSLLSSMSLD